jgi:hypothetical protein
MERLETAPPTRPVPKVPSYLHLPWSAEDAREQSFMTRRELAASRLADEPVLVTEKLDGSNVRLTREAVHSRSRRDPDHDSYDLLKRWHGERGHRIPEDTVLYGEWCYAVHSVEYESLPRFYPLFVFGALDRERLRWHSWTALARLSEAVGFRLPPVIERRPEGVGDPEDPRPPAGTSAFGPTREGYVVRLAGAFPWSDSRRSIAKCVRADHVSTDDHWRRGPVEPNGFVES